MISNYRMVPYKDKHLTDLWAVQKCRMFFVFCFWSNVMAPLSKEEAETLLENLQRIEHPDGKRLR